MSKKKKKKKDPPAVDESTANETEAESAILTDENESEEDDDRVELDPVKALEKDLQDAKGELAEHEEILSGYGTNVFSETVETYNLYNLPWPKGKPSKLYISDPVQFKPDGQSPVFRDLRKKNKPARLIVDTSIFLGLKVYGSFYSDWFQDRYLKMQGLLQDPGEDWFYNYLKT